MATPTNTFRLKLAPSTSYSFVVDWGDGTSTVYNNQTTSSSENLAYVQHIYDTPGTYSLRITPLNTQGFPTIYYNGVNNIDGTNDDVKVVSVSSWGGGSWSSMINSFAGCTNLLNTQTSNEIFSACTSFNAAWKNCTSLKTFNVTSFQAATNVSEAWTNCISLTSFPDAKFYNGPSSVLGGIPPRPQPVDTNFNLAWANCTSLSSFPNIFLSNLGNNVQMTGAWLSCTNLNAFNVLHLTGAKYDLGDAWSNCTNLKSFATRLINTGNLSRSWLNCVSLTSFADTVIGGIEPDLSSSWQNCRSLSSFPLISFPTASSLINTWNGCTSLLDFPSINFSQQQAGVNMSKAWANCTSMRSFNASQFNNAFSNLSATWENCISLTSFPPIDIRTLRRPVPPGTLPGQVSFNRTWANCKNLSSINSFNFRYDTFAGVGDGTGCFMGVSLHPQTWTNILLALSSGASTGATVGTPLFDGGNSRRFPIGTQARDYLIGLGWTIIDAGEVFVAQSQLVIDTTLGDAPFNTFDLPLYPQFTYSYFTVNWGDGNEETILELAGQSSLPHTYDAPGTYTITISSFDSRIL